MKFRFYLGLIVVSLFIVLIPSIRLSSIAGTAVSKSNLSSQVQTVLPEEIQWMPNPNIEGVASTLAIGDPSDSRLYVLLGKMEAGAEFPAHIHPDDRITTVISGVMYYGTGEQLNSSSVKPYPVGSVVYTPAGTPHFMYAKDEQIIMQETGTGPTGLEFTAQFE